MGDQASRGKGQTPGSLSGSRRRQSKPRGERGDALVERGDVVEIRNDIHLGSQNDSLLNVGGGEGTE